ncbi:MAG TPA: DUF4861 family protein [Acidobacteriota bacterium]|nr:DUF4861 family protein [Acidobacteriota bacterium]
MNRIAVLNIVALVILPAVRSPEGPSLTITATNELDFPRPSETLVLEAKDLQMLNTGDLRKIHVRDAQSGRELLTQAIDLNGDSIMEELIFQADFRAHESRSYSLTTGAVQLPSKDDFKAYGRFVRERYDDFAWENDRIAHRMYGTALETWQQEPLTSSAVDVWCKRVRRLVVNDWYMLDHYHEDTGEGGDFYSAGRSRGCGGSGIWVGGKLYVSRNFINSKVIANGPIRVMFELTYAPWQADGREVSEVKRITLDAGSNLDSFESHYKSSRPDGLVYAAGIKKNEGSVSTSDKEAGWLRSWEPIRKGQLGFLGLGIVMDPGSIVNMAEADDNYLVIGRARADGAAVYHAGFAWNRAGDFPDEQSWGEYLKQAALRIRSPLKIERKLIAAGGR